MLDNLIVGQRAYVHPAATFVWHDLTQSETRLRHLLEHYQIEYVFQYAAEPYIPVSFERPLHVFNINAFGALKVINAAHEAKCLGILQVSSAEIYGEAKGKVKEDEPVLPHSSYGAAKAAIDAMVQVRWKEAQTPVIAMRQFNCVGPRETHPYVIPEIINQLNQGPVVKLGNNSFRDFQYSGDAVQMAVSLLEHGNFGEVYNMGSEDGIKIYPLAQMIGQLMGHSSIEIVTDPARVRPWEIWHLQSDNTKLYSVIPLRPQVNLEEALRKTIEFFHANGARWPW